MNGDDDEDDDDWDDLGAVTAVAMEKEIAVEVIGDVLTHTKGKFLPYMQKTIETVLPLLEHPFEGVRKSAIGSSWRAYACLFGLAEDSGMQKWQAGLPLKVKPTDDLEKLGSVVMTGTLAKWEEEIDRYVSTFPLPCDVAFKMRTLSELSSSYMLRHMLRHLRGCF
jgi:hypothetical protein